MSIAVAAQTIMRREQSTFGWTLTFVLLLHAGAFCVALGAVLNRDAVVSVAGGDAGEGGGGGMGFMQSGDAPDMRPPPPMPLPITVGTPKESPPDLPSISAVQQLEAAIDPLPSAAGDSIASLQPTDQAPVMLGLAMSGDVGTPLSPHRGDLERALTSRGQANASAQTGGVPGLAGSSAAQPSGAGGSGASGGPVGDRGAPGAPGIGAGTLGLAVVYPDESRRRGETGTVLLSIEVLADGRVGKIEVLQSSGFSRLDHEAVQSAERGSPYQPAIVDDHPVRSVRRVNVVFRFDDSER